MSRYRPPAPKSSPYITPEGAARLRAELDRLWREERPEVVRALADAAAEGDRSENAEYIYRKKQLGGIDRRIRFLRRRLSVLKVVDRTPAGTEQVFFGAWVTVEDETGAEARFRIVGPDEFDQAPEYISMDAPLARALLKRSPGDEVTLELAAGRKTWLLLEVTYEAPD
ncbi:transcription elongation factor GreB [Thioalkalivibrio sp. XN279]|uniref:transcription elongation factor GreB n=1 Tax=Thioalkalivibrio sp. XN279 TaxID=2714953 RepID=UPI0014091ED8|nr:transcription elongation factor GreB [Thioalkalivibrio sp. XN279]NHA13449.1 transcription elongation factor GreB [Thioalkalivibrio sp. XN279]